MIKVGHLNVRSIFTGFNDVKELVEEQNFDVLFLTETWLTERASSNLFHIDGYRFLRRDRSTGSRGGGVAVYIKHCYNFENFIFDFAIDEQVEFMFFKVKIKNKLIGLGSFYRPPGLNLGTFFAALDKILSFALPRSDEIVCMGDFNVNLFNVNNPLIDCFDNLNFGQLITEPTRLTGGSGTLLDPIFVTEGLEVVNSGTLDTHNISDHRLVFCDLNIQKEIIKPKIIQYRCFKNFNYPVFLKDLQSLPWYDIIYEPNIDNKIAMFNAFILNLFELHAPIVEVKITKPPAPWLTLNLKTQMSLRDKALQKFKRSRSSEDWDSYKRLRNTVVSMVRSGKKRYLDSVADDKNKKKLWSALSDLNVKSRKSKHIPGNLANAEVINKFFSSFLQNTPEIPKNLQFYKETKLNNLSFSFNLTTVDEVHDILSGIKTNAMGSDKINSVMLKYCSPFIDIFITHIINCCFENDYFPDTWKVSIGIPLAKKSNPETLNDIRLISILPTVSKIFEKVMYNQIYKYLITNKILPDNQCGFRKGYSTAVALINVMDDIISAHDRGDSSVLVLLDFSKAFDTIIHDLMCHKLNYCGFNEQSVNLVKSYFNNRTQKVYSDGLYSEEANIKSGVPQGSILGPLFFLIYTADILNSPKFCRVQAYADDTQIYFNFNHRDFNLAMQKVNGDLRLMKELSEAHNLILNPSKSTAMLFGNRNQIAFLNENLNIYIGDTKLPFVDYARNLGVTIDRDLRFKQHLKTLFKKSYSSLKLLYSNRHIINKDLRKTLCETLVLSNFNYCDFVYFPCLGKLDKNRIQLVQNSCSRFVHDLRKFDHVSHTYKTLQWLKMENRVKLHFSTFLVNILSSPDAPTSIKNKLIYRDAVHSRNLRDLDRLTIPQHKSALFQRSFVYNAAKVYNAIPLSFLSLNAAQSKKFKKLYKKNLIEEQCSFT